MCCCGPRRESEFLTLLLREGGPHYVYSPWSPM